jgi:hypothetical protein
MTNPRARGCLRWARLSISVIGAFVLLAQPAAARKVQLDGDASLERVSLQKNPCRDVSAGYGCTRLALRDGGRRIHLTPFTQRPRFPYGWRVQTTRFLDFTGDGHAEIAWQLQTSAGTGSSPSLIGVHHWDGRRASLLFRFANGHKPPPGYAYVVSVSWRILRRSGSLPEIKTRESLHHSDDGTCCPSAYRVMRHRWNGHRIAPVPGSTTIEPVD